METVSLCSGAGGMDLGFQKAGFNIIFANDRDEACVKSYKSNLRKKNNIVLGELRDVIHKIPKHDVLIAGWPCQPFSSLGKKLGFDDERASVFYDILDVCRIHRTKVLVLENVANLISLHGGKELDKMLRPLKAFGYKVYYEVLDAKDFNIPQSRKRVFIVCFLDRYFEGDFKFPKSKPLKVTLQDYLDEDVKADYFLNENQKLTALDIPIVKKGGEPPIDLEIARTLLTKNELSRKCDKQNYITDAKGLSYGKSDLRILTTNEYRKLMGFPKNWKTVVNKTEQYKQFGNAVCVNVAYELAKSIEEYMAINRLRR